MLRVRGVGCGYAGLGITFYYMTQTQPWLRSVFGVTSPVADNIWWDIQPISAGLFGVPLGFLVLKAGVDRPHGEIVNDVVAMVRDRIGPVAFFKSALVVQRLPKTRSGKILRGTMQKIADSQTWTMPATIEDPVVLEEIKDGLKDAGFAAKG